MKRSSVWIQDAVTRPRSRYCREECGVALTVKRIKAFISDRREAGRRVEARGFDKELIKVAHQKIEVLQNEQLVNFNLIKNAKSGVADNNRTKEDISEDDTGADNEEIDCVLCGISCSDKSAARHITHVSSG